MGRRALIAVGALVLLLAAAGVGALIAGGEDSEGKLALVPFAEPPRISSSGHQLNTIFTASEQKVLAGGEWVSGRVYNGEFIGPTLALQPGDTLNLELLNHLSEATNLHFHGFHVSPKPPSDQVIDIMVPPGGSYQYQVHIPSNHDQGTFWYHSHNHHTSEGQVFGGMSGVALIGTPPVPRGIVPSNDRVLAFKDFQAFGGVIPNMGCEEGQPPPPCIDSNAPTVRTVNGLLDPQITGAPGQIELWHLANISADIFYDVQLEKTPFHVLTEDGNAESEIWQAGDLILPPGKRYDVLVEFGPAGTYQLKTLEYHTGPQGDEYPEVTLATLKVAGERVPGPSLSKLDAKPATQALPQPTAPPKTKVLTEEGNTFMINGKTFDPHRIDDYVPLNAVEDWTFVNKTKEQHPIHVHQDDFWVIAENGKPITPKGQQDTVIVQPGQEVTIRIPFYDFTGKFVYHCHILNHEDHGMMGVIEVVPPPRKRA